jgi:SAM-dependent methyltransferase
MAKSKKAALKVVQVADLKLDLGCGPNKKEGFTGVDSRQFDGKVDIVADLTKPWPWGPNSVVEVHCSHMVEHLEAMERVHFVNELYRVLIPGGKAMIITPAPFAERAYGDMTHKWPPVTGFWFYYLDKGWRAANAPHNDFYTCDFVCTWGFSMHPVLNGKNPEYQQHALTFWKEAAQDMICTMVKR